MMLTIELEQETINDLAFLAYKHFTAAFDMLKETKAEVNDNSQDWTLFHQNRLDNATKKLADTKALYDAIKIYSLIG